MAYMSKICLQLIGQINCIKKLNYKCFTIYLVNEGFFNFWWFQNYINELYNMRFAFKTVFSDNMEIKMVSWHTYNCYW